MALTDKLAAIADAIRAKTGKTNLITLDQMPTEIANIETGGGGRTEPYIEETYDANGSLISVNMFGYTNIRSYAFQNCSKLALTYLPDGLTSIGNYAFQGCSNLALASLPDGLTSIGGFAFQRCTSLALKSLPAGLTSIGANAFYGCSSLKTITFKRKPNTISKTAFSSCSKLTTINVPWGEGEVASAPWGATKATINYNYVG